MPEEREIEYKTMLTEQEFANLRDQIKFDKHFKQINYYYDTPDNLLKKNHCGLRVRLFPDTQKGEVTLKTPIAKNQLLETTQYLTQSEITDFLIQEKLPFVQNIAEKIAKFNISYYTLQPLTNLTTIRYEKQLSEECTIMLDQSTYNDITDYELEMEVTDANNGTKLFADFLQKNQITYRKTSNKITRAVKSLTKRYS